MIAVTSTILGNANCMAGEEGLNPQIIAKVNGTSIYITDLPPISEKRIAQYRQLGAKTQTDALIKRFQRSDLDRLIEMELLAQAGVTLDKELIEKRLEQRLGAADKKNGLSDNTIKENLRKEVQRELYLEQKGVLNALPDEKELQHFYDNNRKSFTEPRSAKARHILVQVPIGAPDKVVLEYKEKTQNILNDLKAGKDFAAMAQQVSDCSSKAAGGDLGFLKPGYMPKEFDHAAFTMKPSEISGIVKTKYGFHIIKVEEVRPERVLKFSEVKNYIAGYLRKELQQQRIGELLTELKKTAKIEIMID